MYSFVLMIRDWVLLKNLHWFCLFYLFILIRWAIVFFNALRYRPYQCENRIRFVSVIVPVVDERPDFFKEVLGRILRQGPNELIVVVNGPENPALMRAAEEVMESARTEEESHTDFKLFYTPHAGKRNAIRMGLENTDARSEVTVLVDSDVLWTDGLLDNLLKPFSFDEKIGGVTSRQKIIDPMRSPVTMLAALLEEIRAEGTLKAMSATGKVGCLPGRTIAFRTELLRQFMPEFMTETFMGLHKEVSDDRSLTNFTLKAGYKTVLQDTALVYTDAPVTWRRFVRQQLRWAEGSQYNNIRMTPWMLRHAWLMFFIYWSDMLMPFLLVSVYANITLCILFKALGFYVDTMTYMQSFAALLFLILLGAIVGFGGRNYRAFRNLPPVFILFIPLLTLVLSFLLAPIRIVGLMKCADGLDWGTRETERKEGPG